MKKTLAILALLLPMPLLAQTQPNYAAQIQAAHPTLRMDFNEATNHFKDQISGSVFAPSSDGNLPAPQDVWSFNTVLTDSAGTNPATLVGDATLAGPGWFPGSVAFDYPGYVQMTNTGTANPSGTIPWTFTFWLSTNYPGADSPLITTRQGAQGVYIGMMTTGQLYVIISDGTGAIQVHTNAGTPFPNNTTPVSVTVAYDGSGTAAGVRAGWDGASATMVVDTDTLAGSALTTNPLIIGQDPTNGLHYFGNALIADVRYYTTALSNGDFATLKANGMYAASSVGTVLAQQSGFDDLVQGNKAGSFSADGYTVAPNNTLGSFEWTTATSIHMTIDNPPGTAEILASKGATSTDTFNSKGWELQWTGAGVVFRMGENGGTNKVINVSSPAVPAGYPLDIYATSDGTGTFAGLNLYVNGTIAISKGGTNFASGDSETMVDTTSPLYIAGSAEHGGGGSLIKIDEFDMFAGVASQDTVQSTFANMHWYQWVIGAKPPVPPKLILSEDGCTDMDNVYAIETGIAAHKFGYVSLVAVTSDVWDGGAAFYRMLLDAAGLHHVPVLQVEGTTGGGGGDSICNTTAVAAAYNSSIDLVVTDYPDSTNPYRAIFAGLGSSEKLAYENGGSFFDLYNLEISAADGISSMTGATMFANHVSAAGFQGMWLPPISFGDNGGYNAPQSDYVATHNGAVPMNWYGGVPGATFGSLHTRPHTDPLWMTEHLNGDVDDRSCFDCLPTVNYLTTSFATTSPVQMLPTWNASDGTFSNVASSSSNDWIYIPSALETDNNSILFSWFINSLVNPNANGQPRGD